jgi:2-iminoacetate synthase ThiH
MTGAFVEQILDGYGLLPLLALRKQGIVPAGDELADLLSRADLLALGAAADSARRHECGSDVRIFVPRAPEASNELLVLGKEEAARGTALCRRIAALRLLGPIGRHIVLNFDALGIEIAQVALSFGATDLAGPIANRRGLPLVEEDGGAQLLKQRELAGNLSRAGFSPVFLATDPAYAGLTQSSGKPSPSTPKSHEAS